MSDAVPSGGAQGSVEGFCAPRFEAVRDAFVRNFEERGEVGASVAVTCEGETVVDLWGGVLSLETMQPWTRDTVSLIFSSSKGILALVANVLIDRGLLDPWQPIAEVWPEFAANGKEKASVRMALNHSLGLPVIRETVKPGGFYDWDYMCDLIARQKPFWQPGNKVGYHALTLGWIVGELIRRTSGKSVGANIREILSRPLGLDLWCGLPEDIEPRVARMIPSPVGDDFGAIYQKAAADPESISALALDNDGGWLNRLAIDPETGCLPADSRASHAAEIPAANNIANARALAGAYRPFALGGGADGLTFVGPSTLLGMEEISSATDIDQTTQGKSAWTLGFNKGRDKRLRRSDPLKGAIIGRRGFGHTGAGGSFGFADPGAAVSFGYTINKMSASGDLDERGVSLIDALYESLGYQNKDALCWMP